MPEPSGRKGYSRLTVPVAFRIPNEVAEIIQRRIAGPRSRWSTINEYIRDEIIWRVKRKHGK